MIALIGIGLVIAAVVVRALRSIEGRPRRARRQHWRRAARHLAWRRHRRLFPRWYDAHVRARRNAKGRR